MIFYILFFLILGLSFLHCYCNRRFTLAYSFIVLTLIFLAGFRYECGADFDSYKEIYNDVNENNYLSICEPVFGILNYGIKSFFSFPVFLLVIASLSLCLKSKVILKYSCCPFYSLLLYFMSVFLTQDMGQIRQGLAVSVCWCAFPFLAERKMRKYILLVVLASLIHFSAFICLLVFFFRNLKLTYINTIITFVVCICMGQFVYSLLGNIDILGSFLQFKLHSYWGNDEYGSAIGLNWGIVLHLIVMFLLLRYYDILKLDDEIKKIFVISYFIGNCVYFLCMQIEIMAGRLSLYYISLDIILIPIIVYSVFNNRSRFCVLALHAILLYYLFASNLNLPDNNLIPYKNILTYG